MLKECLVISLCICFFNITAYAQSNKITQEPPNEYYDIVNAIVLKDTIISKAEKVTLDKYVKTKKYTSKQIKKYLNKKRATISQLYYKTRSEMLLAFLKNEPRKNDETLESLLSDDEVYFMLSQLENDELTFDENMVNHHIKISKDNKRIPSSVYHYFSSPILNQKKDVMIVHHKKYVKDSHYKYSRILVYKKDKYGKWNLLKNYKA